MKEVSATVTTTGQDLSVKKSLRFGFQNGDTAKVGGDEIVENLARKHIDLYCVQNSRWKEDSAKMISSKDCMQISFGFGAKPG